ncbi:MAG: glnE, partial [Frankiales bacterium]|nr:glnE [Frankiales bacterium]
MIPREASELGRLVRLGFADPRAAGEALTAAGLWLEGEPIDAELVEAIADTADPDLAAAALGRLLAVAPDLRAALGKEPVLRSRLLAVLGGSVALGDHLVAYPEDWRGLRPPAEELGESRPSALGLQRALLDAVGAVADETPWGRAGVAHPIPRLRHGYRSALVALAARDLAGELAVEDVAGELADLASATVTAALAVAAAGLPANGFRLAVLGLGKCGGRELNYVSDVDVVFVAEPLDGTDEVDALKAATALAGKAMEICAQVAWPVDAALRPEGKSGPLVRTLARHVAYYQRWAKTCEFQALLKARPIAGDLQLGKDYVDALSPLVWSAGERPGFVEDVQAMRRRVEGTLKGDTAEREVKLGPGGLRDVEFSVQLLQLVHGRTDDSVRSGTTLVALDQLAAGGYVGREDARHLAEAYRWLRTVEHRLQLHRLKRTHLLPPDDDEQAALHTATLLASR